MISNSPRSFDLEISHEQDVARLLPIHEVLAGIARLDDLARRVDQDVVEEVARKPQSRREQRVAAMKDVGAVEFVRVHVGQVAVRFLVGIDRQDDDGLVLDREFQLGQHRRRPIVGDLAIGDIDEDHDRLAAEVGKRDARTDPGHAFQRRRGRRFGSFLPGTDAPAQEDDENHGHRARVREFHGIGLPEYCQWEPP